MESNPLLREFSVVLNLHQDLADVLGDDSLSSDEKLVKVKEINNRIGEVCAEVLPG
jgi:hypothetical protein